MLVVTQNIFYFCVYIIYFNMYEFIKISLPVGISLNTEIITSIDIKQSYPQQERNIIL